MGEHVPVQLCGRRTARSTRLLSNKDDDAVARVTYLQQALAPGQVTVVTRDFGMRTRPRIWKLKAAAVPEKPLIPADKLSSADLGQVVESTTMLCPRPEACVRAGGVRTDAARPWWNCLPSPGVL
ncbi:hypothetical protein [Streptomyces phaeofaciens]|uniref:hypothetical protein n=1 Tax=Streptomyces phaeofaciens TaxID=68254 RepID=UPI003693EBE5